jgi:hypothetical protein
MIKTIRLIGILMAGSLASGLAWGQSATLIRASDLKEKPYTDAATIASLKKSSKVHILQNSGGWTQVRSSDGHNGWVRLLAVKPDQAASANKSEGLLHGLSNLGNVVRTGSTGATATTGAKGISQDDLARATPDHGEVKRMELYKATSASSRSYARSSQLQPRNVDYLEPGDAPRN